MEESWQNHALEAFEQETGKKMAEYQQQPKPKLTIGRKLALQAFKVKWNLSSSKDDTWGDEVQGYADMTEDSPIPAFNIFHPNSTKEIRLRFFNHTVRDEAATDLRCAFLKFGDAEGEGPMDMAFTTGSLSLFNDSESLQDFLTGLEEGPWALKSWALKNPTSYVALVEGLRRAPESWTHMDYYSHVTYSCLTGENTRRLFRFRLVGTGNLTQSKLSPEEQKDPWKLTRPDNETTRPGNVLSENLERVATANPTMRLQIQYCDVPSDAIPEHLKDPCISWDDAEHPWEDIADIVLTYKVPKILPERARYNFEKIPEGLVVETLPEKNPYTYLLHIREKVLFSTTRSKTFDGPSIPEVKSKPEMTTYLIHTETGFQVQSGTSAAVSIAIYGTQGRTKKLLLDKSFHDDFERGRKDAYYLPAKAVGDIKFVKVYLVGGGRYREWFLRNIVIFDLDSRKSYDFPCFQWITANITLSRGKASLVQDEEDPALWHIRKLAVIEKQKTVGWHSQEGHPGRIDYASYKDLPRELKFAIEKEKEKRDIVGSFATKLKLHHFMTVFNSFDDFEDFRAMAEVVSESEVLKAIISNDNWKRDEEFGRMFLDGINPIMIKRCDVPLENFPVTDEMVGGCLDRGMDLEEEMEAGNVYLLDYKILDGISRKEGKHLATPLCFMYVRSDGSLVPIAIQLEQTPSEGNPIWTPNDDEYDWLLVKTWVKVADAHLHAICTHYLRSHVLSESFVVSMLRNLPPVHPVYKFLAPHVKDTIAVNSLGRDTIIGGNDSLFSKVFSLRDEYDLTEKAYREFRWVHLNVPKELALRGVDDPEQLPNYHYRDDALAIWNCISDFVSRAVNIYYTSDSAIEEDMELQDWIRDIKNNGLVSCKEDDNGVPGSVESVSHLVEILTVFIYNVSCFHAAVNFGQPDYYLFGPNYPTGMRAAPPKQKGETGLASIIAALPTKAEQTVTIVNAMYLSAYTAKEVMLGEYPDAYFTEPAIRKEQTKFQEYLKTISEEIEDRNESMEIPYTYLLPGRIPNSITA